MGAGSPEITGAGGIQVAAGAEDQVEDPTRAYQAGHPAQRIAWIDVGSIRKLIGNYNSPPNFRIGS